MIELIVMSRADYEALDGMVDGVPIEVSDIWTGPPRGFTRSEAEAFRSKNRLAEFRIKPVEM
jgi:hypothetical protein